MRTLYIDGFFVFGLALTTVPMVGLSSPRFSMPLISVRTSSRVSALHDIGTKHAPESPFRRRQRLLFDLRPAHGRAVHDVSPKPRAAIASPEGAADPSSAPLP